jgi:hypothetical protein
MKFSIKVKDLTTVFGPSSALAFFHQKKVLTYLGFILLIALSICYQGGSFLHLESASFLVQYLKADNLFKAMFDIQAFEWGWGYQGRELSHFIDGLDAYFLYYSFKFGIPHFYSAFFYLVVSFCSIFFTKKSVQYFGERFFPIAVLLVLLLLTSPQVVLGGMYFRSSKIGVAGIALFTAWWVYGRVRFEERFSQLSRKEYGKTVGTLAGLTFLASWFDLQGFALGVILAFILAGRVLFFPKSRQSLFLLLGSCIGLALSYLYRGILGPIIIEKITGLSPKIEFNKISYLDLFLDPYALKNGWGLLLDHFNYFFGNLDTNTRNLITTLGGFPILSLCIFLILTALLTFSIKKSSISLSEKYRKFFPIFSFLSTILLLGSMYTIMASAHNAMLWSDVRITYYLLPVTMIFIFGSAYVFHILQKKWTKATPYLVCALSALIVSNVFSLHRHVEVFYNGYLKAYGWPEAAPPLKLCLTERDKPAQVYSALPNQFMEVCVALRKRMKYEDSGL